MSNPQQAAPAPVSFMTTAEAAARWDAAREIALRHAVSAVVTTARYHGWELRFVEGGGQALGAAGFVGVGESSERPFADQDLEDVFCWVDDADWLDGFPQVQPVGPAQLAEVAALLADVGDFRPSEPLGGGFPPGNVRVLDAIHQLAMLRLGLRMSQAVQRLNMALLRERFAAVSAAPAWVVPETDSDLLRAARDWVAGNAMVSGLLLLPRPDSAAYPLDVGTRPTSPLQVLWLALSVSMGAVDSNLPAPYVCDHRPCGRVFVSNRHRVRGEHRFCSTRCGKRFSAVKDVTAKRAAARAAKSKEKETGHGEETGER